MKNFRFQLDSLLRLRARELETEEMRLATLRADLTRLERDIRQTVEESQNTSHAVASGTSSGAELGQLQHYRNALARKLKGMVKEQSACQFRIEQQQRKVVEANRRKRLIERLKERRLAEWTAEVEKEFQQLAEETYLSSWNRQ